MTILHRMNQINLLTVPNSKSHKIKLVVEHVQFHRECSNHGCESQAIVGKAVPRYGNADVPAEKSVT